MARPPEPSDIHPSLIPSLSSPKAERLKLIRSNCWVGYPGAKQVLAQLEDLMHKPRIPRMTGMALMARPNNGKSTVLRRLEKMYPPKDDPEAEALQMPVLLMECPPSPDEGRFYNSILDKIGAPFRPSSRPDVKHRQVKVLFAKAGVRILILDEAHNVINSTPTKQRYFLQVLKYLSNDLQLPIVVAGTDDVANVLATDAQISSRFPAVYLDLWEYDDGFGELLAGFEYLLPLKEKSNLDSDDLASELFRLSEGILGELAAILTGAACAAINGDKERITLKTIRSLKFVPFSRRRRRRGDQGGTTPGQDDERMSDQEEDGSDLDDPTVES